MLVLSRKADQSVWIGDEIEVKVLQVRGNQVKLGFRCPREIPIVRSDVASGPSVMEWEAEYELAAC